MSAVATLCRAATSASYKWYLWPDDTEVPVIWNTLIKVLGKDAYCVNVFSSNIFFCFLFLCCSIIMFPHNFYSDIMTSHDYLSDCIFLTKLLCIMLIENWVHGVWFCQTIGDRLVSTRTTRNRSITTHKAACPLEMCHSTTLTLL